MNGAVANHNDNVVRGKVNDWLQHPVVYQLGSYFDPYCVTITSLPRFNAYDKLNLGNYKGVAIMSGHNNKFDGRVKSFAGYEGLGSIDLELCLSPHAMTALESDQEFMETISVATPLLQ